MGQLIATTKKRMKDSPFYFVTCELPTLVFIAIVGFIVEFFIELPFMVVCLLAHRWEKQRRGR